MSLDNQDYIRPTRSEKKQSAALEGVNRAVGIRKGIQCPNLVVDQNTVMFLLNSVPSNAGGALFPTGPTNFKAPRQGFCDASLFEAIRRFQRSNGLSGDGVVDPGGPTAAKMRVFAHKAPTQSGGGDLRQKFIDDVQNLLGLLKVTAQRMSPSPEGSQFAAMAVQLEMRLKALSGAAAPPLVLSGISISGLFGLMFEVQFACNRVRIDSVDPFRFLLAFPEQAGVQEIVSIARRADELASRTQQAIIAAMVEQTRKIQEFVATFEPLACRAQTDNLVNATEELESFLRVLVSSNDRDAGDVAEVARAGAHWLVAVGALIVCAGPRANPLVAVMDVAANPGSLPALLRKFFGVGGNLPRLSRA